LVTSVSICSVCLLVGFSSGVIEYFSLKKQTNMNSSFHISTNEEIKEITILENSFSVVKTIQTSKQSPNQAYNHFFVLSISQLINFGKSAKILFPFEKNQVRYFSVASRAAFRTDRVSQSGFLVSFSGNSSLHLFSLKEVFRILEEGAFDVDVKEEQKQKEKDKRNTEITICLSLKSSKLITENVPPSLISCLNPDQFILVSKDANSFTHFLISSQQQ
jgi:hypothetical protein